jgi:hypothetical protein
MGAGEKDSKPRIELSLKSVFVMFWSCDVGQIISSSKPQSYQLQNRDYIRHIKPPSHGDRGTLYCHKKVMVRGKKISEAMQLVTRSLTLAGSLWTPYPSGYFLGYLVRPCLKIKQK